MKLTITRSNWLHGEKYNSRLLRTSDNKMCCLGFLAKMLGSSDDDIKGQYSPATAPKVAWIEGMVDSDSVCKLDSRISDHLMQVNDNQLITDTEREEKLQSLFSTLGVEVEFVD